MWKDEVKLDTDNTENKEARQYFNIRVLPVFRVPKTLDKYSQKNIILLVDRQGAPLTLAVSI